jgi:hypothetical protein
MSIIAGFLSCSGPFLYCLLLHVKDLIIDR